MRREATAMFDEEQGNRIGATMFDEEQGNQCLAQCLFSPRRLSAEELGERLLKACKKKSRREVESLLDQDADVRYTTGGQRRGKHVIHGMHVDIESRWIEFTPLMIASQRGDKAIIQLLLDRRADVNDAGNDGLGVTALGLAVRKGCTDAIRVLLEHKADVEHVDSDGRTMLDIAAQRDSASVIEVLLEHRADVHHVGNDGQTALGLAARKGCAKAINVLLQNHANANHADTEGLRPLDQAAMKGSTDAMELLLEHGADVQLTDHHQRTALIHASLNGRLDAVMLLLDNQADVNHISKWRGSALEIAGYRGDVKMFMDICAKESGRITSSNMSAALSVLFTRDDSGPPMSVARSLLVRVLGQGIGSSVDAFAEISAPDGFEVWFQSQEALRLGRHEEKQRLVDGINGTRDESLLWSVMSGRLARRLARPVKVDLYEAPDVTVDVFDHRELVVSLASTSHLDLLSTPLVECMISHMWRFVAPWAYLDIIINACVVLSACLASADLPSGGGIDPFVWKVLAAAIAKRVFEEVVQFWDILRAQTSVSAATEAGSFYSHRDSRALRLVYSTIFALWGVASSIVLYICSVDNIFDVGFVTLGVASLTILDDADTVSPGRRFVLALWFALLWLRLLYSLRVWWLVGPRFLPIFRTVNSVVGFYFVVAFTFAASVHGYLTLAVRDYPGPFYAAFVQMFRLYFFGDFELDELEGVDPTYEQRGGDDDRLVLEPVDPVASENYAVVHGLFYVVAIMFSIVLMNLFIGVLSTSYSHHEEKAWQLFLQSRADAVVRYRCLPWVKAFSWLQRRRNCRNARDHLCALVRCAPLDDSKQTERTVNEHVDQQIATLRQEFDAKLGNLEQNIRSVDQKMDLLLQHMGISSKSSSSSSSGVSAKAGSHGQQPQRRSGKRGRSQTSPSFAPPTQTSFAIPAIDLGEVREGVESGGIEEWTGTTPDL